LRGFAAQIQLCSLTGSYVMATAEHWEPYESRGSRTVLGARGGEIPPRDSTRRAKPAKPAGQVIAASLNHGFRLRRDAPLAEVNRPSNMLIAP
jgi:hypothetical protein